MQKFDTRNGQVQYQSVQRRLIDMIHTSSRMAAQFTAQRQQLNSLTRETAQREVASAKPNNTGLPDNLKNGIESLSGVSMDNVKVNYNSPQPAQLNAHAFAQGTDIHIAPAQEQHLPHKAWHVVRQAQGRVKPTVQMKNGVSANDDADPKH